MAYTRIAPGLYDDGAGGMHIDVPELLRASGFADTPYNRELLTRVAADMARERYGIRAEITTDPIPLKGKRT